MIVYSTDFNASVDTNLESYGAPDWYKVQATANPGDLAVIAADDDVQLTLTGTTIDFGFGLVHSLIGGVNDYLVTALVRRGTLRDMGTVGVRCGPGNDGDFYAIGTSFGGDDIELRRYNSSGTTILKTTAATIPTDTEMTVTCRVSETNPVVLEYSVNGISDSYSDSDAGRHQSGPPGVFLSKFAGVAQNTIWVTSFSVDNLLSASGAGRSTRKGLDKWEVEWDGVVKTFKSPLDAEAWLYEQVSKRNRERALAMAREKARIAARIKLDAPSDFKPLVNIFWTPED